MSVKCLEGSLAPSKSYINMCHYGSSTITIKFHFLAPEAKELFAAKEIPVKCLKFEAHRVCGNRVFSSLREAGSALPAPGRFRSPGCLCRSNM